MIELNDILKAAVGVKASDIFLVCDQPPMARIAGNINFLQGFAALSAQDVGRLVMSRLFEQQANLLQQQLEIDCSIAIPQLARFRMNVTTQQNGLHAVIHVIASAIPSPEDLDLPEAVVNLSDLPRGLVLVTGPSGSGKSATLVCLIEQINKKRSAHIVTIEDPIEFFYVPRNSVICQREMGTHARSYARALKSVMKQSVDVVLIGELRDMETAETALHIAESGALVFSTLPTTDSMQTIEKIVNMFPVEQHRQIRLRLAANLEAAISQVLLPRADGKGRIAAREILIMNPTIENAVREGKTPQIYGALEAGVKQGMINMDKSILRLARNKLVSNQVALEKSHHPDEMQSALAALK